MEFSISFSWDACVLNGDQKRQLEDFLVEYHDVFAKHRFVMGYNTELEIKLTPEHPLPMVVQGPPAVIHLGEEILIELVFVLFFTIITLSHSKFSKPILVNCNSFG